MFLDPRQRTIAIGVWIASFSAGGAVGPLLGGVLLEHFWWGSVFLHRACRSWPCCCSCGPRLLPEFARPGRGPARPAQRGALARRHPRRHLRAQADRASDGFDWLPRRAIVALGLVLGVVFVHRQRPLEDPMIDLELFRRRAFNAALATNVLGVLRRVRRASCSSRSTCSSCSGSRRSRPGCGRCPRRPGSSWARSRRRCCCTGVRPAYVIGGGLAIAAVGFAMLTQLDGVAGCDRGRRR